LAKAFLKIFCNPLDKSNGNEKNIIKYILAKHNHYRSALANGEEQKNTTGFSHKKNIYMPLAKAKRQ
jgi:hypothetical protein